nr:MAG TPA: hypothetical protein [Caudoviricetes sp.]
MIPECRCLKFQPYIIIMNKDIEIYLYLYILDTWRTAEFE